MSKTRKIYYLRGRVLKGKCGEFFEDKLLRTAFYIFWIQKEEEDIVFDLNSNLKTSINFTDER